LAVVVLGAALPASALTLNISSVAPTPDADDIYNFAGADRDGLNVANGAVYADGSANDVYTYVAGDRTDQGQTFTTGSDPDGYVVTAIWVRHCGYTNNTQLTWWRMSSGVPITLRLTAPAQAGSAGFSLHTESYTTTGTEGWNGTFNSTNGTGQWLRLVLAAPQTLLPNQNYGFDLTSGTTGAFFEWFGTTNNVFAGGNAYRGGTAGAPDNALNALVGDRVFLVELAAVTPSDPVAGIYFQQQPTDANVGIALAPAVTVVATNASGVPVTNAPITLSLVSGSGALNGTLAQVTGNNGAATFANLSLTTAGVKQLQAASGAITAPSATFNIIGIPVVATTFAPTNTAAGLCVDTLLRVTFDKAVTLQKTGTIRIYNAAAPALPVDTIDLSANVDNPVAGTATNIQGRIIGGETFTNHPVTMAGSIAMIYPHSGVLTTNQTYYVLMDSGIFTDSNGNVFPGISATNVWRFTTKATGPANSTNLVVAADGSGDFCTVQGAVDFVPNGSTTPRLINVRNGFYYEIVNINNRHKLTFRGQSRANTIIGYDNNAGLSGNSHFRMAFKVIGNDIALDTLTITNISPKGAGQAEALMVESDQKRFVAWNVTIGSYQDTILLNNSGTQCYFQDSSIQGDVDFIWGAGNAFFTNCEIKSLNGGQITQARTSVNSNGFAFVNCRLTRLSGAVTGCGFGRSLGFTDGNVAYVNCLIDSHITGWQDTNARYWEYGNSNLLGTAAVTYNGIQLAANSPDLINARSAVLWLNGWTPALLPTILSHPTNQACRSGQSAVFTVSATGFPTPTYQWRKNGVNISGATNATYTIASSLPPDSGTYSVLVSTSAGSVLSSNATLTVTTPAFPGAEGAGANALGGRGGDVYYVTTLNDANTPGALRYGINNAPGSGRTILFKVSGNIELTSTLTINNPRITIAGQSAPGDGICIQNYPFNIGDGDIIVRHLRTRLGTNALVEADSMWIVYGTNIMVDHLSASWSVDETLSVTRNIANLTVQNSFITESLRNSIHAKGAHGYGGIISSSNSTTISYHHNLYAFHDSRNPRLGADSPEVVPRLDFRNNVVYGWGFRAGYSGATNESDEMNYVNNYVIAGPFSSPVNSAFLGGSTNTTIYQSGNLIDSDQNGVVNGVNTGWGMFTGTYTQSGAEFDAPALPTDSAGTAYQRVLAASGAMPWRRDALDQRIVRNVRRQAGQIVDFVSPTTFSGDYTTNIISGTNYIGVNPWPVLASQSAPVDSDNDGMPDFWETALGLATNNASDRNLTNALGYTRLEDYLNWLADPHALSDRNGFVDFNLRTANGGATNLSFSVANGTNGTVVLLGDGYTARFVATNNFSGLASFTYTANDPANGLSFGPVSVGVLITITNAPNTPPTLAAISNATLIAGATLTFTNSATDNDVPAQTLTYSLLGNSGGAMVTPGTGIFNWRPTIAQGGMSNAFQIVVTDSGTPALSATQAFNVIVSLPAHPVLQSTSVGIGQLQLLINGATGPDYLVQASTNLMNWSNVTNFVSPVLPFTWTDTNAASLPRQFYRVRLGP
jgi:hypothetical protein